MWAIICHCPTASKPCSSWHGVRSVSYTHLTWGWSGFGAVLDSEIFVLGLQYPRRAHHRADRTNKQRPSSHSVLYLSLIHISMCLRDRNTFGSLPNICLILVRIRSTSSRKQSSLANEAVSYTHLFTNICINTTYEKYILFHDSFYFYCLFFAII